MEDFFEGLEDEDFAALATEFENAFGAIDTFLSSFEDNLEAASAFNELMVLFLTGDTDAGVTPYIAWVFGEGCGDACDQVATVMGLMLDVD